MTSTRIGTRIVTQHGSAAALSMVLCAGLIGPHQTALAQTEQASDERSELRAFYSANGLLNRGLHDLAIDEYRSFLRTHGDHAKADTARYGLGVCLFRLQRYDESMDAFEGIQDRNATGFDAEIATMLGQASLAQKQFAEAESHFAHVLSRHADHALADDAGAMLVESCYRGKKHDAVPAVERRFAEEWADSAMHARAQFFIGLNAMSRGDHENASRTFAALNGKHPKSPYRQQAQLMQAQCLRRAGKTRDAMRAFDLVIADKASPYVPDALYGSASILHEEGDSRASAERLQQLQREHGAHRLASHGALLRGRSMFDLGQYEEAESVFATLESKPGVAQDAVEYWRAKCALRMEEPARAAARLARARAAFPTSNYIVEMSFDHAVALLRSGNDDASIPVLRDLLASHPRHRLEADAMNLLAGVLHSTGAYEQSAGVCRAYVDRYPKGKHVDGLAFLGAENAFLSGEFDRAATLFMSFVDERPRSGQVDAATYRLGMSLYRMDQLDEAEPWLQQVVDTPRMPERFNSALLALGDLRFQYEQWPEAAQLFGRYVRAENDSEQTHDALLKMGIAHLRHGGHDDAIEAFTALLGRDVEGVLRHQALFERGQALVASDRHDEAVGDFTRLMEEAPESRFASHACNHLGAIASRNGASEEAARWYALAAENSNDDTLRSSATLQRAMALMASRSYADAEVAFAAYLENAPAGASRSEAMAQRCIALARLNRHDDAVALGQTLAAAGLDDLSIDLHSAVLYECAWSLKALSNVDGARSAYEAILALKGETALRANAMIELADLETSAGNTDRATILIGQVVDTLGDESPMRQPALYRHGALLYEQGKFKDAAARFSAYVEAFPDAEDVAAVRLLCGESFFRSNELSKAVQHLQTIMDRHQNSKSFEPALLRLGECRAALQHWARSEEVFRLHQQRFKDSAQWYQSAFGLGWAMENQGRSEDAMRMYERVTDRHEGATAARAQFQIGECLYAAKSYEDAIRAYLKVDILYGYPEWAAAALYEAGRCFEELKNPVEARKHYELVLERAKESNWASLATQRLARLSQTDLPGRGE